MVWRWIQNNTFQEEIEQANDFSETVEKLHAERIAEVEKLHAETIVESKASAAAAVQAKQWASELSMVEVRFKSNHRCISCPKRILLTI